MPVDLSKLSETPAVKEIKALQDKYLTEACELGCFACKSRPISIRQNKTNGQLYLGFECGTIVCLICKYDLVDEGIKLTMESFNDKECPEFKKFIITTH